MTDTSITPDIHESLHVLRAFASQVTLDGYRRVDRLTEMDDLVFSEIADLGIRVDPKLHEKALGRRAADAVDVGKPDLDSLLRWDVDTRDTRHTLALPLPVTRVAADDLHDTMSADHLAFLAHGLH
jgi:hypothetical protein